MNNSTGILDLTSESGIMKAFNYVGGASSTVTAYVVGAYLGTTVTAGGLVAFYSTVGSLGWYGISFIPSIAPWAAPWIVPFLGSAGIYNIPALIANPIGITVLTAIGLATGITLKVVKDQLMKLVVRASQLSLVDKFLNANGKSSVKRLEIKAYEDIKLISQILDLITENQWYKLTDKSTLQIGGRCAMKLNLSFCA